MNKIIEFLKQSNRYKHLIGGLLVGILAFTPWTALYAAAVAASCLELKDKLKGGLWDWIDWSLTVIGGIVSLSLIGGALKKMMPKFKVRRYGCKTLGKLYEKLDRYELVMTEKGVANAVRLKY